MDIPPAGQVVLVLAAGTGSRYRASGGRTHKLDALINGTPVLEHVLQTVRKTGLAYHVVLPSPHCSGMADSIATGVRATAEAKGWLILPGDLPLVQPATLFAVASALATGRSRAVIPHCGARQGHPVGFHLRCYSQLAELRGDNGAASLLKQLRQAGQTHEMILHDLGMVTDIDTVDDLNWARALHRTRTPFVNAVAPLNAGISPSPASSGSEFSEKHLY